MAEILTTFIMHMHSTKLHSKYIGNWLLGFHSDDSFFGLRSYICILESVVPVQNKLQNGAVAIANFIALYRSAELYKGSSYYLIFSTFVMSWM